MSEIKLAKASGAGNLVVLYGAKLVAMVLAEYLYLASETFGNQKDQLSVHQFKLAIRSQRKF
jgi:hypothetical protein